MYYPRLFKFDPFRPLDWRWQRAVQLQTDGANVSRKRDDEVTCDTQHYLRQVQHRSAGRRARFADSWESIRAAIALNDDPSPRLQEIQARFLARQTMDEIAQCVGIPASVLTLYEALFYNVIDKLNARDWIATRTQTALYYSDKWAVLRYLAYVGGPIVLHLALPHVIAYSDPAEPGTERDAKAVSHRLLVHRLLDAVQVGKGGQTDVALEKILWNVSLTLHKRSAKGRQRASNPAQAVPEMSDWNTIYGGTLASGSVELPPVSRSA